MPTDLELLQLAELLDDPEELEDCALAAVLELRDRELREARSPGWVSSAEVLRAMDRSGRLQRCAILGDAPLDPEAGRIRLQLLAALPAVLFRLEAGGYLRVVSCLPQWPNELSLVFTRGALLGDLEIRDCLPSPEAALERSRADEKPAPATAERSLPEGGSEVLPAWVNEVLESEDPLMERKRVADLLKVSQRHLRRLIDEGSLPTLRRPGASSRVLIPKAAVANYLLSLREGRS